jgi:arylsulfatase A-like enzyme
MAGCGGGGGEAKEPLNLLVVVLDTLRPDRLGCYGYERPTSPHLDELARDACVFEDAQSTAPWTAPAMISMVTSLYPGAHGVYGYPNPGRLNENTPTLAGVLSAHGWRTAAITEGGYASGKFGLDLGFQEFRSTKHGKAVRSLGRGILRKNVEQAVAWLELHRDEATFLLLHTYEPHAPYRAPPEYVERVHPDWDGAAEHALLRQAIDTWNEKGTLEPESMRILARHSLAGGCIGTTLPRIRRAHEMWERAKEVGVDRSAMSSGEEIHGWMSDQYDAGIAYADEQLGHLWKALDDLQLRERTIVVVLSDHGESLGEKGMMGHGHSLSEELLRIVLLMRLPGQGRAQRRIPEVVSSVDVMPTLLDLMGVDPRLLPVQGRSLRPLLEGGAWEQPAFSHALNTREDGSRLLAVRVGPWRLVLDDADGSARLYDVHADRRELRDLAAEQPDVVARLGALLEQRAQHDDSLRAEREQIDLDPDTILELRRLGYLGGD